MYRIVIPARYASSRFPGKPLVRIAGKPMLQHVHARAMQSTAAEILIATDDARIVAAAEGFGARVMLTASGHATGTDRIAEVARLCEWGRDDVVVNLQGDEPSMPVELLDQVAALLLAHAGADIATLASPIENLAEYLDPNVVKVVTDVAGRALYFSRAPIPWHRDDLVDGRPGRCDGARRHIGLYAYRVGALERLAALPVAPLEEAEKLEQLRALHHGMEIRVANAARRPGPDVNTPDDLRRAESAFRATSG